MAAAVQTQTLCEQNFVPFNARKAFSGHVVKHTRGKNDGVVSSPQNTASSPILASWAPRPPVPTNNSESTLGITGDWPTVSQFSASSLSNSAEDIPLNERTTASQSSITSLSTSAEDASLDEALEVCILLTIRVPRAFAVRSGASCIPGSCLHSGPSTPELVWGSPNVWSQLVFPCSYSPHASPALYALLMHALCHPHPVTRSPTPWHALGAQEFSAHASSDTPGHELGLLTASLELLQGSAERSTTTDRHTPSAPPSSSHATVAVPPAGQAEPWAAPAGVEALIDKTTASPGHTAGAASTQAPNAHGILVPDWVLGEAEAAAQGLPEPPVEHEGAALPATGLTAEQTPAIRVLANSSSSSVEDASLDEALEVCILTTTMHMPLAFAVTGGASCILGSCLHNVSSTPRLVCEATSSGAATRSLQLQSSCITALPAAPVHALFDPRQANAA